MDERLEIETPFGPVWLRGRDTGKPALVVIHGAFAQPGDFGVRIPGFDTFDAHLPGNHCPDLVATNVGVWGAAYRAALAKALPGRDIIVVGVSTGALIALAMRSPLARRMVLIEPPLRPHLAWPLRLYPDQSPAWGAEMLWQVFGVARGKSEPRDYTSLLATITVPTFALVGGVALGEPRAFDVLPSLVDPASRDDLARHPLVDFRVVPGAGHNVPRDGRTALQQVLVEVRDAYCTS